MRAQHDFARNKRRAARHLLVAIQSDPERTRISTYLRRSGYCVIEASTGAELLDLLGTAILHDAPELGPAVIITDAILPGVTGASVATSLRQLGWQTPILLLGDDIEGCFPSSPDLEGLSGVVSRALSW